MLPLLFSTNDRARNRKRGNYAGDKSRMHLQNPSRKQHPSRVCGAHCHAIFAKQNPELAESCLTACACFARIGISLPASPAADRSQAL
jgi:hypothetical protein